MPQKSLTTRTALGSRIRSLRKGLNLTQENLAERTGLSIQQIGSIERGVTNPTLASLEKLALNLGVSLSELFDLDPDQLSTSQISRRVHRLLGGLEQPERRLFLRMLLTLLELRQAKA